MVRATAGLVITLALLGPAAVEHAAAQEGKGPLRIESNMATRTIGWMDYNGEVAYRVSGSISYWQSLACGEAGKFTSAEFISEEVNISQELPADTTAFQLPPPQDQRADFIKDMEFALEALGPDGEVLARDGFALTVNGFCAAEELAAAGTGFRQGPSSRLLVGLTALLTFGIVSLFGGLIALRKRT